MRISIEHIVILVMEKIMTILLYTYTYIYIRITIIMMIITLIKKQ